MSYKKPYSRKDLGYDWSRHDRSNWSAFTRVVVPLFILPVVIMFLFILASWIW